MGIKQGKILQEMVVEDEMPRISVLAIAGVFWVLPTAAI